MYMPKNICFALMRGIDHGLTPVVQALPSDARHARSEATRLVTAHWTTQTKALT